MISKFTDNDYGLYEGICQACDNRTRINDIGLCEDCNAKFDRDVIRQRKWAYSASAFGVPEDRLEDLRNEVIKHYGEKLELLAPE